MITWIDIRDQLSKAGVSALLYGSLANGGFMPHSDLDILVQSRGSAASTADIYGIVHGVASASNIEVDLFFEEDFPSGIDGIT